MVIELTEEEAETLSFYILRQYDIGPLGLLAVKLTEENEIILKIKEETEDIS